MKRRVTLIFIALLLLFSLTSRVSAESAHWQPPLIYPLSITETNLYESEVFITGGTITSFCASWESSGVVRLTLSANGGKDYVSVINGVPIRDSFIPGNQLRFRAILEPKGKLTKVTLYYIDTKTTTAEPFTNPQLAGFQCKKAIDILGSPDKELFNYQLKVEVGESRKSEKFDLHCEGKVFADFRDIRFTLTDGQTLLPFYLEGVRGKPGARTATFWIKIPQIPQKDIPLRIYLYYANPQAQDKSSPEETFDFFDDFNNQELNTKKWETQIELKGEAKIINKELRLINSTVRSREFRFADGIIEFCARIKGAAGIQGIIRGRKQKILFTPIEQAVYSSGFSGAEHTISVGNVVKVNIGNPIKEDNNYFYRIIAEGLNFTFERYAALDNKQEAQLSFQDIGGLTDGYIGLRGESAMGQEAEACFDWIRVRQYVQTLPRILEIGKEEEIR